MAHFWYLDIHLKVQLGYVQPLKPNNFFLIVDWSPPHPS